jgi:hypothetical protein
MMELYQTFYLPMTRELFLSSPLGQREKAQRRTGGTTYVDMTINNVLKKRRNPPMKRGSSSKKVRLLACSRTL